MALCVVCNEPCFPFSACLDHVEMLLAAEQSVPAFVIMAFAYDTAWPFDTADTMSKARQRLGHWNRRAANDWPGFSFSIELGHVLSADVLRGLR